MSDFKSNIAPVTGIMLVPRLNSVDGRIGIIANGIVTNISGIK